MELSRRDILKLGMFGSAALLLPAERIARTQLAVANRIPQSRLPAPFSVPFAQPPVLAPAFADAGTAYYDIAQLQTKAEILPGLQTTIWGYNGITPGPTIVTHRGQRAVVRQTDNLPDVHPTLRYTSGPRRTCTARRRCPSTTATPATSRRRGSTRTTSTPTTSRRARSGTTTTACTSRRPTPTWAWRRCTSTTTSRSSRCRSRTGPTTSRSSSRTRCSSPTAS